MQINYYINNQEVEKPLNYAELSVELNYDKDDVNSNAVSLTEFEWGLGDQTNGNDAARLINAHRTNGLTSGVGVFEGLPFRIELTDEGTTYQLFDGYLNTATALYDCDKVIISAQEKGNIDWLNDVADSVSFEYLYDPDNVRNLTSLERITQADFIPMPYVISELPDNREALLATISLTYVLETFATELENFLEVSARLVNPIDFMVYVEWSLRLVYLVSLFALLIVTIQRIRNLLIQDTKYHFGMTVKTLCEKGAAHFGKTFQSSILDSTYNGKSLNDLVIIPQKYSQGSKTYTYQGGARLLGNPKDTVFGWFSSNDPDRTGFYKGTYGDLLRGLKELFNAKIVIDGNIIRLEEEKYNNSAYNYVLPPIDDEDYSLNFSDLKSNYVVEFLTDINDKNTLQNYSGTVTQVITQPQAIVNRDMVLMSGLESRTIPFARASRKEDLTGVEKIVTHLAPIIDTVARVIIDVVNAMIDVIDFIVNNKISSSALLIQTIGITNYVILVAVMNSVQNNKVYTTPTIAEIVVWFNTYIYNTGLDIQNLPTLNYTPIGNLKNRIGMMLLENDFIDVPKIFLMDITSVAKTNKIYQYNSDGVNSAFVYENYHKIRNFVPSSDFPNGNQYKIYSLEGIHFCFDDYQLLRNNNRLQDSDNRNGTLISATWNPETEKADIQYRINETYTNNLKVEKITPDGK